LKRLREFFTNTFIGGLVVILPVLIFVFLINWLVGFFGSLVEPLVQLFPITINENIAKFLAFLFIIAICFFIGLFIRTRFGNSIFSWFENSFFKRLPFYSTIRETVIQFIGNDKTPFSKVVLVKPYGGNAKIIQIMSGKQEYIAGLVIIMGVLIAQEGLPTRKTILLLHIRIY